MSYKVTPSSELSDCIKKLNPLLNAFCKIINSLIAVSIGHESAKYVRDEISEIPIQESAVLTFLLQAAGSSTHTLMMLSDSPGLQTRDCYSISRSIIETVVNSCYIMAEGEEVAERAIRHARQKFIRDFDRESKIGDCILRIFSIPKPDLNSIDGMADDLAEFQSKSGWEKGWTDLSIDDRIRIVGSKLGIKAQTKLHFARFMIYRHSSEILHGTFFGANYFAGNILFKGRSHSRGEMADSIGEQHMGLLLAIVLSLSATIDSFNKAYGFEAAQKRSDNLIDELIQLMKNFIKR